jgi:chromosome segregation protein
MYLRALRLKGFKSFPKQTELIFEPGVAVIIGPNGSGKSNLSDAVMWVLGEQSPSSVRGASMKDVIFAGSDGRRASAGAEVEITFDNSTDILPLPTPEVSVGRRVDRGGESKYFINQSPCRLTDVVELMAGLGLGKEMHSIVGQGKVESFLNSKPVDRRALIEEAAGLGRYKRRRERAELKLREVRRNLERVELLEREVTAQLTPLRRQASAAEQLRAVDEELAATRGRLIAGETEESERALATVRSAMQTLDQRRRALEEQLGALATQRLREEEEFSRRLEERERRAKRVLRARVLSGRLDSCERLTAQRVGLVEELQRAAAAERERLVAELAGRPEDQSRADWPAERARLVAARDEAEARHAERSAALASARAALADARAAVTAAAVERESALSRAGRLRSRAEALRDEIARHERQLAELDRESTGTREAVAAAQVAAATSEAEMAAVETAATTAQQLADVARQTLVAAEERVAELTRERRAVEAQIEHEQAALHELRDVEGDVLAVAGEFPGAVALSSIVACERGYERALAAALAQVSGALAVPDDVDHWSLLAALKRAGVGLVRLVVVRRDRAPLTLFPGAVRLVDKVVVEGPDALAEALASAVVVDDLRAVPESFEGLAVTRDGEYYRPADGQLGLAAGVPAALILERRVALETAQRQLDALRVRDVAEQTLLAEAGAQAQAAAQDARATREKAAVTRAAADEAARAYATAERRRHEVEELHATADRRGQALRLELEDATTEAEALDRHAAGAFAGLEPLTLAQTEAATSVEARQAAADESLSLAARARVELEERQAAAERAEQEQARAAARARDARARLAQLDRRLATLPHVLEACAAFLATLSSVRGHGDDVLGGLEGDAEQNAVPARDTMRELADREAELRRDAQTLADEHAQSQVALARLEDRAGGLGAELEEIAARLERASFLPPVDEGEAAALREQVERLVRRRERIGPVNPLAEAECAELSERAAFVREQRRDLEQSSAELLELIKELTVRIDADFSETFVAVQTQFEQMIAVLFPDGRGRLLLVDGETDGEPGGVAVEVKPARKMGKKLQLLSGGERALAAIAFLMALVLSRPCPFYILDEIEAALDDINIGRFVGLVREYRERTQFIIVTHQKRTMEAADVLYGVTMGPDGASRVVSARMAEEEIDRESAAKKAGGSTASSRRG